MQNSLWLALGGRLGGLGGFSDYGLSPVDEILQRERYTLEELLDVEEIIQEAKFCNSQLLDFLSNRNVVEQLVRLTISEPPDPNKPATPATTTPNTTTPNTNDTPTDSTSTTLPSSNSMSHTASSLMTESIDENTSTIPENENEDGADANDQPPELRDEEEFGTNSNSTSATAVSTTPVYKNPHKFPYIASELLGGEIGGILDILMDDDSILITLFSILDRPPPLDPSCVSYFRKVLQVLIQRKYFELIDFIRRYNIVDKLLRHLGLYSIMELIIMIGWDSGWEPNNLSQMDGMGNLLDNSWMITAKLIPKLVRKLHPSYESLLDVHAHAGRLLVDVVVKCPLNTASPLIDHLQTTPILRALFQHMFSGCHSSLSNSLSVIIVLVQRFANRRLEQLEEARRKKEEADAAENVNDSTETLPATQPLLPLDTTTSSPYNTPNSIAANQTPAEAEEDFDIASGKIMDPLDLPLAATTNSTTASTAATTTSTDSASTTAPSTTTSTDPVDSLSLSSVTISSDSSTTTAAATASTNPEIMEPFLSLLPHLARILEILEPTKSTNDNASSTIATHSTSSTTTTSLADPFPVPGVLGSPSFGSLRMKVVELCLVLARSRSPYLDALLVKYNVPAIILRIFYTYDWNNLLHGLIESIITSALEDPSSTLTRAFFSHGLLLDEFQNAYQKNERLSTQQGGTRLGYMGHLIRTAATINHMLQSMTDTERGELLGGQEYETRWNTFITQYLTPELAKQQSPESMDALNNSGLLSDLSFHTYGFAPATGQDQSGTTGLTPSATQTDLQASDSDQQQSSHTTHHGGSGLSIATSFSSAHHYLDDLESDDSDEPTEHEFDHEIDELEDPQNSSGEIEFGSGGEEEQTTPTTTAQPATTTAPIETNDAAPSTVPTTSSSSDDESFSVIEATPSSP